MNDSYLTFSSIFPEYEDRMSVIGFETVQSYVSSLNSDVQFVELEVAGLEVQS